MVQDPEITLRLAQRLKQARAAKGLSLEALARLSGVSRSMLSQIERGASSPTVASLWNLTQALNVDFAGLLDEPSRPPSPILDHMPAAETPSFAENGQGCVIRILSSTADVGKTEVYDITFAPGGVLSSAAHDKGTVEHLSLLEGRADVTSGDDMASLAEGDTLRYRADLPHEISAPGGARLLLIVKHR
jgi:transcriptional regulator with XRE-family HTH domain